jgi:hypothetical protein
MIEADRVLSTPPLNSSSIQEANSPPEALADSAESFFKLPAIGQPESRNLTSESGKPAERLSRRNALAVLAAIPCIPVVLPAVAAQPDPIFAAIEAHRKANAAHEAAIKSSEGLMDWSSITEKPCHDENDAFDTLIAAPAATLQGLVAKLAYLRAIAESGEAWMLDEREGTALHLIDSFSASLRVLS